MSLYLFLVQQINLSNFIKSIRFTQSMNADTNMIDHKIKLSKFLS